MLLLSLSFAALAADTWSDPYPGVRHLHRVTSDPQRIHVLVVDLDSPAVRIAATRTEHRGRTTSSFASLYGCQLAVNGDFYTSGYAPRGIAVGAGVRWPGSDDGAEESFIAFGSGNQVAISAPWELVAAPEAWMTELVSGRERVTENGAAAAYVAGNPDIAPRTAAGLDASGRTLYLAVVDGRTSVARGMTLFQLGGLMAEVGAWTAINLDGGGSTDMVVAGSVVNSPSDGSERVVANHLGVRILPYSGRFEGQSWPLSNESVALTLGETVDGWIDLRNMGTATWTPGVTKLAPIPRDLPSPVGGPPSWQEEHRVSTVAAPVPPGAVGRFPLPLTGEVEGEFLQTFGLVEEGVTWFADSGGPPDSLLAVRVVVTAPEPVDTSDSADSDAPGDETDDRRPGGRVVPREPGCACDHGGGATGGVALGLAALAWRHRRHRRHA